MADKYYPDSVPAEYNPTFVEQELERISRALSVTDLINMEITYKAPDKPREGDIRFADGVFWNPSASGKGLYIFYDSLWRFIA